MRKNIGRRRGMKKAIELLEEAKDEALNVACELDIGSTWRNRLGITIDNLEAVIAELQHPRWETPEQWEKCTGEKYPDTWAVYMRVQNKKGEWAGWLPTSYGASRLTLSVRQVVCATEAGPPPDTWVPEEAGQ
jgi:hypothetical protein